MDEQSTSQTPEFFYEGEYTRLQKPPNTPEFEGFSWRMFVDPNYACLEIGKESRPNFIGYNLSPEQTRQQYSRINRIPLDRFLVVPVSGSTFRGNQKIELHAVYEKIPDNSRVTN